MHNMVQQTVKQTKSTHSRKTSKQPSGTMSVGEVLISLEKLSNKRIREQMGPRFGIYVKQAYGISMADIQKLARTIGRDHELALALWETGWYEARLLAAFVDEPAKVTSAQMDRWCRDFDNWGVVDTICFKLFDQTPHAFSKVVQWSKRKPEFERRAAFVLIACLAAHDKEAPTEAFRRCFPLIEKGAGDDRNFVKKGVSWALRMVGRRNLELHNAAVDLAQRLSTSSQSSERWIGKAALKELTSPAVVSRFKERQADAQPKKTKKS